MRRTISITLLVLLLTIAVYPCLWPVGERYTVGKPIDLENLSATDYVQRLTTSEGRVFWDDLLRQLREQDKAHPEMGVDNNVAVALIHLGNYHEALTILRKAEKEIPDFYHAAANLGTAYELLGQNDKALHWIRESLTRDPESHFGTEWVHVKILEAKIAMEKEPGWLEKRSVLGLNWEAINSDPSARISVMDYRGQPRSAKEIEDAVAYQLHERLEFVNPPEPIVAQLLYDLSNLVRRSKSPEHADAILNLAIDYGHQSVRPPASTPTSAPPQATSPGPLNTGAIAIASSFILAITLVGGYYFLRRRRQQRTD